MLKHLTCESQNKKDKIKKSNAQPQYYIKKVYKHQAKQSRQVRLLSYIHCTPVNMFAPIMLVIIKKNPPSFQIIFCKEIENVIKYNTSSFFHCTAIASYSG